MKKKIIALLQARTDSTRLPNKVLKKILNKPMIIHQLQRTIKSKYIDELIVVTSNETNDDELSKVVENFGFNVYRGNKNNVLKRFYDALVLLDLNNNDIIVRLTGDCPVHDAGIIDETIVDFLEKDCDYLSNCENPVYPDGLDVEVFNYFSLKKAYDNATLLSELEHVTPYICDTKNGFKICEVVKRPIYNEWRLTVDEDADFQLITKIYEYFMTTYFSFDEMVKYLEKNRNLIEINSKIKRNEGYEKSLYDEKEIINE